MSRPKDAGTCTNGGCERSRIKNSIMCAPCTSARRQGLSGPSKTSDGVITGGRQNKLSDDQVAELRRMWSQFKSKKEIAAHFNVSRTTVDAYLKRARSAS